MIEETGNTLAVVRRVGGWLTATELATLTGVGVNTVSNWRKRHSDFPQARHKDGRERFPVPELLFWLDGRRIAKNVLRVDETPGTTYGLRFRRTANAKESSESTTSSTREVALSDFAYHLWRTLPKFGFSTASESTAELVLELWFLRSKHAELWKDLVGESSTSFLEKVTGRQKFDDPWSGALSDVPQFRRQASDDPESLLTLIHIIANVDLSEVGEAAETVADLTDRLLVRVQDAHYWTHVTPPSLIRCMVGLTRPRSTDAVYEPFCGAGELVVAAANWMREDGVTDHPPQIVGQAVTDRSRNLTKLRALLHSASVDLGVRAANPLHDDLHVGRQFDVILANPPFNASNRLVSGGERTWPFAEPPSHNANFAWLQHIVAKLAPNGRAAVLMPNLTTTSEQQAEWEIRAQMIEAGTVDCIVAMPSRLFQSTGVPVSLWILRSVRAARKEKILFIDASALGAMVDRTQRVLSEADTDRIVDTYLRWTQTLVSQEPIDVVGFATTAGYEEIRERSYLLNPRSYVRPESVVVNRSRIRDEITEQGSRLARLRVEADRIHSDAETRLAELLEIADTDLGGNEVRIDEICGLVSGPGTVARSGDRAGAGEVPLVLPRFIKHHRLMEPTISVTGALASRMVNYRLEPGDIVCTRTGDLGRYGLVGPGQRGWLLGPGCMRIRPNTEIVHPGYLTHYLSSDSARNWLQRNATGSAIKTISRKVLGRMSLVLPDLSIQWEIGALLGLLDAESELYDTSGAAVDSVRAALVAMLVPAVPTEGFGR